MNPIGKHLSFGCDDFSMSFVRFDDFGRDRRTHQCFSEIPTVFGVFFCSKKVMHLLDSI